MPSAKHILVFLLTVNVKTLESSKMKITGKVTVPGLTKVVSLAKDSYLIVKFEDISVKDTESIVLGEQEQKLDEGTKLGPGTAPLNYTIVCDRPKPLGQSYSVSAVLNVGWHRSKAKWLEKGDFYSDTTHSVSITKLKASDDVTANIVMVGPYNQ